MLTPEEEKYISSRTYIPEHILNLMVPISKGEPYLRNGYLFFLKDEWIIFIGYPLDHAFTTEDLENALDDAIKRYGPENLWLIAPEIPSSIARFCQDRESDHYYKLELMGFEIKKDLIRIIKKASGELIVRKERRISEGHKELISEFIEREKPNALIRALFLSMEEYVKESATSAVLSAYNKEEKLTAFYVVELGAIDFATYVVGTHSKKRYISGSSDILFLEMTNLAKEYGKSYIHLGLGVNEGIRRFKEKWGGIPSLKYEFCEYIRGSKTLEMFKSIGSKL
jgi:hypothetical protein